MHNFAGDALVNVVLHVFIQAEHEPFVRRKRLRLYNLIELLFGVRVVVHETVPLAFLLVVHLRLPEQDDGLVTLVAALVEIGQLFCEKSLVDVLAFPHSMVEPEESSFGDVLLLLGVRLSVLFAHADRVQQG